MPQATDWSEPREDQFYYRYPDGSYINIFRHSSIDGQIDALWTWHLWAPTGDGFSTMVDDGYNVDLSRAMEEADRAHDNYIRSKVVLTFPREGHGHQASLRIAEYRRPS